MKITIVHPAVGKKPGEKYIRAWQMEPLPVARLAALLPNDIELEFWDDRMESIPFDNPTDLVLLSIETYTAKRSYQIATEFRKRKIKVVMGGFHATLCPQEVGEYADALVIGEAESCLRELINDFIKGELKQKYQGATCDFKQDVIPDRTVYEGKNYLKIALLEAGRGCKFKCEFCSIHNFFNGKHHFRKVETIVEEIKGMQQKKRLFFFVDDNIVANQEYAIHLFLALKQLKIKWVGQADITIAKNPELLRIMAESGCQGVLIGFESLQPNNLKSMNKNVMSQVSEIEQAIKIIHKAGIRIYGTFLFGYEHDTEDDFKQVLNFCITNKLFIIGFNHLTPFPGTKLYERLKKENKLLYEKWWMNEKYTYGQIPFHSKIHPGTIEKECRKIRTKFFGLRSMLYRMSNFANINSFVMFSVYVTINTMLRKDTLQRKKFPLGDTSFKGDLIKVKK